MTTLEEVAKALGRVFFVATVDAEGRPRVRPFGIAVPFKDHLWFGTNSEKKVFKELQQNPFTEISVFDGATGGWWRVHGGVHFGDEPAVRQVLFGTFPELKSVYTGPDDPVIRTFWVEGAADYYSLASGPNRGPARTVPLT
jgi:uncharacterized pyridoxamine 5'-phosphate oxidase family protein